MPFPFPYLQVLRAGTYACRIKDRDNKGGTCKGCGGIFDRGDACYVHSGRSRADDLLGDIKAYLFSCPGHHCPDDSVRDGSDRTCDAVCNTKRAQEAEIMGVSENSVFWGAAISLLAYELGLLLKRKFRMAIFNPLLIAIICVIGVLAVLNVDYESYDEGGKYISYLLTPATVSLAVPLYQQLTLLRKNLKAVAAGILSGVLASLVSIFLLAKLFQLSHEEYVTLLPKSITTAIGMGVSEELGGIVTITVAVIIITGVLGNMTGDIVCRLFRIQEPVAKGLALGTSAHAIGTAKAMELGEVEGAMSSLAIAVAGLLTVVAASVFANFM